MGNIFSSAGSAISGELRRVRDRVRDSSPNLRNIQSWNGKDWGAAGMFVGLPAGASFAGGSMLGPLATPGLFDWTGEKPPDTGAPPTINEANDPNLQDQFKRMRAAARALGRAGTIKYKGTDNLGYGSTLGSGLSLSGSNGTMA
jgi:hypothetical protein